MSFLRFSMPCFTPEALMRAGSIASVVGMILYQFDDHVAASEPHLTIASHALQGFCLGLGASMIIGGFLRKRTA